MTSVRVDSGSGLEPGDPSRSDSASLDLPSADPAKAGYPRLQPPPVSRPVLVGPPSPARTTGGPHAHGANLTLVLQTVYRNPGLTRAELARRTGLTRVTISELVNQLIDDQLVCETGLAEQARPGKKAISLAVRDDTTDIIACDLSGSEQLRAGVYSIYGQPRREVDCPIDGVTGESALDLVTAMIADLVAGVDRRLLGIGIGMPGTVDPAGRVLTALALGWHDLDLRARLTDRFGTTVAVMNDANAGVLAEQVFGAGSDNQLRVQIARGVGAGLLIDGQVVVGQSAAGGEIGHLVVQENGRACRCGQFGCLETWASVPALEERMAAEPARRQAILAEAGRWLGLALVPTLAMLDIDDIILGGESDLINGAFAQAAETMINQRLHSQFRSPVALKVSPLDADATLLGAVALILRTSLGLR